MVHFDLKSDFWFENISETKAFEHQGFPLRGMRKCMFCTTHVLGPEFQDFMNFDRNRKSAYKQMVWEPIPEIWGPGALGARRGGVLSPRQDKSVDRVLTETLSFLNRVLENHVKTLFLDRVFRQGLAVCHADTGHRTGFPKTLSKKKWFPPEPCLQTCPGLQGAAPPPGGIRPLVACPLRFADRLAADLRAAAWTPRLQGGR